MKKTILLTGMLILRAHWLFAEPGPEIPKPAQTVAEAVRLAWDHFVNEKGLDEKIKLRRQEYIVVSVLYETPEERHHRERPDATEWLLPAWAKKNERTWFVEFVHPVLNDHSSTYRVMRDGTILEVSSTI
jgi:hypothetical protein